MVGHLVKVQLEEVIFAAEHPKLFSSYLESVQLMEEGIANTGYAAIAGALLKGSIGLAVRLFIER